MSSEHACLVRFCTKLISQEVRPNQSSCSQLSDLHIEVHANTKEEGESRSYLIHIQASLLGSSNVLQAISYRESELKFAISSSFLHVVA